MAMEKLILRSVMYGADKIPDSWFEKIPGGYFKDKRQANKRNSGGAGGSGDDRRRSNAYYGGRQYEGDNNYEDGYRSEGQRRRHRRSRSSYDGGADEEYDRNDDDRRTPRRSKSRQRRRSVDNDRYGYDDGRFGKPRDGIYEQRYRSERPQYSEDAYYDNSRPSTRGVDRPSNPFHAGAYVTAGAAPYTRSSFAPSPAVQLPRSAQQPQERGGGGGNGYVPYSEIYAVETTQNTPQQSFSQPFSPQSTSNGSEHQNERSMFTSVASPPSGYKQNPLSQQHPTAADAGAGMQYTGQQGFINTELGYGPGLGSRRYPGYDENQEPHSESPPPQLRYSRHERSHFYNRDDPRTSDRRSRSERPKNDKSRNQGYGAIGAVAGGMLGSEFGKGAMPKAIGAALGGLGANAFEARERYVDPRTPPVTSMYTQLPPPTNRRKDDRRYSAFERDGRNERRDERPRRDEGYYSD